MAPHSIFPRRRRLGSFKIEFKYDRCNILNDIKQTYILNNQYVRAHEQEREENTVCLRCVNLSRREEDIERLRSRIRAACLLAFQCRS